jgi:hypothetical protein
VSDFPDYVFSDLGLQPLQPATLDWGLLTRLTAAYADLPPIEPIKLTQEQWDKVKAAVPVETAPPAWSPRPIFGVPVIIVDRIEESTPWKRWVEKVKAEYAAEGLERLLDFGPSGSWKP